MQTLSEPEVLALARTAAGGGILLQRIRRMRADWAIVLASLQCSLAGSPAWSVRGPEVWNVQADMARAVISDLDDLLAPDGEAR